MCSRKLASCKQRSSKAIGLTITLPSSNPTKSTAPKAVLLSSLLMSASEFLILLLSSHNRPVVFHCLQSLIVGLRQAYFFPLHPFIGECKKLVFLYRIKIQEAKEGANLDNVHSGKQLHSYYILYILFFYIYKRDLI